MGRDFNNLTDKQVINICDGRILGYVADFKINPCDGHLTAIIIPGNAGWFCFKKSANTVIPWENIYKIGIDVILVDIGISQNDCCEKEEKYEKRTNFKIY